MSESIPKGTLVEKSAMLDDKELTRLNHVNVPFSYHLALTDSLCLYPITLIVGELSQVGSEVQYSRYLTGTI